MIFVVILEIAKIMKLDVQNIANCEKLIFTDVTIDDKTEWIINPGGKSH